MSDLRRLDEIVQKVDDKITFKKDLSKPYVGLEHIATRSSYLSGFSEANTSISTNAVFSAGDVLFGKLRPNLRKCVVAPFDGYCSTDILVLRANSDVCNRFAGRVFQTEKVGSAAEMTAIGTKMPRTSWIHLKEVEVYYPDRHSQEVIANILDTLDTTIRQTEAIIAKLQQVKQGLLHDLLTRGIDANGQLRPPVEQAPHLYKESPLGWIPREWEVASLLDRVSLPQGQVNPLKMPYSNWILIAPDHIESGTGTILSKVTAAEQGAISGKYIFQTGDILYSKIRPYLRKAALADSQGLCSADMYPLRPSPGVDSRFVLALILSEIFTTFAVSVSMRTGIPKINREELSDFAFGWPSSDEQIQIANMLSAQERKIASSSEELLKLKNLKSALMDDLLTGRMRVTALLSGEKPASKELKGKPA